MKMISIGDGAEISVADLKKHIKGRWCKDQILKKFEYVSQGEVEDGLRSAEKYYPRGLFLPLSVYDQIEVCYHNDSPVLILGETGTGKEMVAKAIHELGDRKDKPFVPINCAGFPEHLLESELFGHVRGAFTGAIKDKQGLVEEAEGGTLFLDEIGDMPIHLQAKLLRLLNDGAYRKVGDTRETKAEVRIIAATNKPLLDRAQREGGLRSDLFYRLSGIPIKLPLLRDQWDIFPFLVYKLCLEHNHNNADHKLKYISKEFLTQLLFHEWGGNFREFRAVFDHSAQMSRTKPQNGGEGVLDTPRREGFPDCETHLLWAWKRGYIRRYLDAIGAWKPDIVSVKLKDLPSLRVSEYVDKEIYSCLAEYLPEEFGVGVQEKRYIIPHLRQKLGFEENYSGMPQKGGQEEGVGGKAAREALIKVMEALKGKQKKGVDEKDYFDMPWPEAQDKFKCDYAKHLQKICPKRGMTKLAKERNIDPKMVRGYLRKGKESD